MQIDLSRVAIIIYASIYFVLAAAIEAQNVHQGYPYFYVGPSMIAQLLVIAGIFLFALDAGAGYLSLWRWLFPLLILELGVGLYFDATIPAEPHDAQWLSSLTLDLWFELPAYYCNFMIARYGLLHRGG